MKNITDCVSILKKHLKPGDLITHVRCMGYMEEHRFIRWYNDTWICGKPTSDTVRCGGSRIIADDISPRNVTHVNREPVENLDFLEALKCK